MDETLFSQDYRKNLAVLIHAGYSLGEANSLAGQIKRKKDAEAQAQFRKKIDDELKRCKFI